MFKFAAVAMLLVVAVSAQWYGEGAGSVKGVGSFDGQNEDHKDHHHSYPKYKFEYGVKDPHTGDHKSQWEVRDGDVVKGGYSLHEADGTERVVEYTSDKHNGFQAHVKKVGHAHHPQAHGHHAQW